MPNSPASKPVFASPRLDDVLAAAAAYLRAAGIENPELDARWLIGAAIRFDRTQIFMDKNHQIGTAELSAFANMLAQRAAHRSVARILGAREFWTLSFGLNEATLEPRPDSETLIESTLKLVPDWKARLRILDLGTGTGCLLLSLLHELHNASGIGVDLSPRAVEQAQHNAANLNLASRSKFAVNSWFDGIDETFDIIISNPPYIESAEMDGLMPEVRDYDPYLALDGGADGLEPYRAIVPQLQRALRPRGIATFEVGHTQAAQVADMLRAAGFEDVSVHRDFGGNERCVIARKP